MFTSTTFNSVLEYYTEDRVDCEDLRLYTNDADVRHSISKTDSVKRARPPEPMFLNPTACGLHSKIVSQYGQFRKTSSTTTWCDATARYVWTNVHQRVRQLPIEDVPSFEGIPPWELMLRLAIKDRKVNLGTSLVEYRQTSRMFSEFAKGARTAWNLYRGKLPRSMRRRLRPCDVPAAHIVTTYGVEPLVSDLFDSYQKLANRLTRPIYERVSSGGKKTTWKGYQDLGSQGKIWSQRSDWNVVYLTFDTRDLNSEFTLGNPLELAWEVIPFSFVIDWGIGVGEYLSSLDAMRGARFVAGTHSTKRKWKRVQTTPRDPYFSFDQLERPGICKGTTYQRTVMTDIPFAPRPRITISGSYRRLANAVALLATVNKRCRNKGKTLIR